MKISRRDLLRSSVAVGGAAALGGLGSLSAEAVAGTGPAARAASRAAAGTTTRTVVLGKGTPGTGGWAPVVELPGESWVVRGGMGAAAKKGREKRRRALLAFAQLSDIHIVDAQSPMRLEFAENISSSAYRPQEFLSGHVANAMVRAINEIGVGPVTGSKLKFAIQTGDNSDSRQYNEIRWNIDVLDGGTITVDSGDLTKYEGVADQDADSYNTMFWHPDGTPEGKTDDLPRSTYGFPTVPGLLDAARAPFDADGLAIPWYTAMGNHDGLIQGNFPASDVLKATAIGSVKKISVGGATRTVTADPNRRIVERSEWVQEHFTTTGLPVGHGFSQANVDAGTAYYTFDRGIVRFIVLDSVAPSGDQGALDATQIAWLKKQLKAASRSRLVVLASHHPLSTFKDQTQAATIEKLLLQYDNVIAWVNGHTHNNNIWMHTRTQKGKVVNGFWDINTASHIDWPQQSRLIEIVDNRDGTLSIFTTMVDHAGSLEFNNDLEDPIQLAGLSRLLTANDWQERDDNRRGRRIDRNVELVMRAPAFMR